MISLIGCGLVEEKLAEIQERRHEWLSAFSDFSNAEGLTPMQVTAKVICPILEMEYNGEKETAADWVQFFIGGPAGNADLKKRNEEGLTEELAIEAMKNYIETSYPGPNDSDFEKVDQGYMTFLPYVLEHLKRTAYNLGISQLYEDSKTPNEEGQFDYPNKLMTESEQLIVQKIREYKTHYYTTPSKTDPTKRVATPENNAISKKLDADLLRIVHESRNNFNAVRFPLLSQISNFLRNLPVHLAAEAEYLMTYAQIAPVEQAEEIADRINEIYHVLTDMIVRYGRDTEVENLEIQARNAWHDVFVNHEEVSNTYKYTNLPKVVRAMAEAINDKKDSKTSFRFIQDLLHRRITFNNLNECKLVLKSSFGELPEYYGEHEKSSYQTTLRIWDFINELNDDDLSEEQLEEYSTLWGQAVHNLEPVLSMNDEEVWNYHLTRELFFDRVVPENAIPGFYHSLYEMVLDFSDQNKENELTNDNIGPMIDAYIDGQFETNQVVKDNYLAYKVHVAIMSRSPDYEVNFVDYNQEDGLSHHYFTLLNGNADLVHIENAVGRAARAALGKKKYVGEPSITEELIQGLSGKNVASSTMRVIQYPPRKPRVVHTQEKLVI
jgi:hypothetical protein